MPRFSVLALPGSLRATSHNAGLLRYIAQAGADRFDCRSTSFEGMPIFDADDETASGLPEPAQRLIDEMRNADILLISTPEYNASIPGGLKNAIDWISRAPGHPLKDGNVAVIGAAAGIIGAARAQSQLREALRSVGANIMNGPEIFVGSSYDKFDGEGNLTDQTTRDVLDMWIGSFTDWAGSQHL